MLRKNITLVIIRKDLGFCKVPIILADESTQSIIGITRLDSSVFADLTDVAHLVVDIREGIRVVRQLKGECGREMGCAVTEFEVRNFLVNDVSVSEAKRLACASAELVKLGGNDNFAVAFGNT